MVLKSIEIWQKISGRVCRGTESGKLDRGIKAELSGIKKRMKKREKTVDIRKIM